MNKEWDLTNGVTEETQTLDGGLAASATNATTQPTDNTVDPVETAVPVRIKEISSKDDISGNTTSKDTSTTLNTEIEAKSGDVPLPMAPQSISAGNEPPVDNAITTTSVTFGNEVVQDLNALVDARPGRNPWKRPPQLSRLTNTHQKHLQADNLHRLMRHVDITVTEHLYEPGRWDDCARLFCHDPYLIGSEQRIRIKGFNVGLFLYQAFGISVMFEMEQFQGGGYNADDVRGSSSSKRRERIS